MWSALPRGFPYSWPSGLICSVNCASITSCCAFRERHSDFEWSNKKPRRSVLNHLIPVCLTQWKCMASLICRVWRTHTQHRQCYFTRYLFVQSNRKSQFHSAWGLLQVILWGFSTFAAKVTVWYPQSNYSTRYKYTLQTWVMYTQNVFKCVIIVWASKSGLGS